MRVLILLVSSFVMFNSSHAENFASISKVSSEGNNVYTVFCEVEGQDNHQEVKGYWDNEPDQDQIDHQCNRQFGQIFEGSKFKKQTNFINKQRSTNFELSKAY